jgi:hypothetical protein
LAAGFALGGCAGEVGRLAVSSRITVAPISAVTVFCFGSFLPPSIGFVSLTGWSLSEAPLRALARSDLPRTGFFGLLMDFPLVSRIGATPNL